MKKSEITAIPGKQEVTVTSDYDAPRPLVYQAHTDPKLIPQWWGPAYLSTTIEKLAVKPGGEWRFVQRDAKGNVYGFHGVYHSVKPPENLVYTFEFEGTPGHVLLVNLTFEEVDAGTRVIEKSVFQSVEDRDGMLNSGMKEGSDESYERLKKLLAEM